MSSAVCIPKWARITPTTSEHEDVFSFNDVMVHDLQDWSLTFKRPFHSTFLLSIFQLWCVPFDVIAELFEAHTQRFDFTILEPQIRSFRYFQGVTPTSISSPQSVCPLLDGVGMLIADSGRGVNRIFLWRGPSSTSTLICQSDQFHSITRMLPLDNNIVIVLDTNGDKLHVLSLLRKKLLYSTGEYGAELGRFRRPQGVSILEGYKIIVADTQNHRLQAFEWSPKAQRLLTLGAIQIEGLISPTDVATLGDGQQVAVAANGTVFVVDVPQRKILRSFVPSFQYGESVCSLQVLTSNVLLITDAGSSNILHNIESGEVVKVGEGEDFTQKPLQFSGFRYRKLNTKELIGFMSEEVVIVSFKSA
eukprot:PhF_6_TR43154/c1_g1_i8/m.66074